MFCILAALYGYELWHMGDARGESVHYVRKACGKRLRFSAILNVNFPCTFRGLMERER
ncbi:hypothetical protein ALMA_0347 [Alloscardovia macacae]|uniref:Uncharacterized protein n=1 Tax=Alloscardovia macacae TaxID=1160091 RepID=A0A261F7B7_9BIFI|nr:hypothetical protein ALMA_0347 [Alloscardovia macacae]